MSDDVYPANLPGLAFSVVRSIVPPPVTIITTPSTREYRSRDAAFSRIQYTLPYEYLRSDPPYTEMQVLANFYNDHGGPFDSWLFFDPDDNAVVGQYFGVGNASTTDFQLTRQFGNSNSSVYEPIYDLTETPTIHFTVPAGTKINLLQSSTAFDAVPWFGDATVTANTTNDPNGVLDADTVADTSGSAVQYRANFSNIYDDAQAYRFSVYVKQTTGNTAALVAVRFDLYNGTMAVDGIIVVNTDSGVAVATIDDVTSVQIVSFGGYWRITGVLTNNLSGNVNAKLTIYPCWALASTGSPSTPNVAVTGSAVFWGAKIEVGSTLTSFTGFYFTEVQGLVSIHPPPGANQAIYWDGTYVHRCRFTGPTMDVEKFMNQLWTVRNVQFITTRS